MSQEETVGDLEESVGYALKQAAVALRAGMDAVLRPLGLSTSQYSCLEVLAQQPGLSNAELARATFVTRQAMDGVLRGLVERGLVTRSATAPRGRALPTELTASGREHLHSASAAVRAVERRMLAPLDEARRRALREDLAVCTAALGTAAPPAGV